MDVPQTMPIINVDPPATLDTDELAASLRVEFGNFDLSRIPARIFLLDSDARRDVRNESR